MIVETLLVVVMTINNIAKVICFVVISGKAYNSDNVRNEIHIKRYSAKRYDWSCMTQRLGW